MRAILTYHSIDPSRSPVSIDEATFRAHVDWLVSGAVDVVPLEAITAHAFATGGSATGTRDAVALTFDDGFVNFAEVAWPLLAARGLPVTLFVASARAGADNAWGGRGAPGIPTLPLLGWPELARLADEGLSIQSHSRTHPDLRRLSDDELRAELVGAADEIEARTGRRPKSFCYPYGHVDARVADAARSVYARACTTRLQLLRGGEDALRLPRLDAFYLRDARRLARFGSPAFARYIGLRDLARRARGALSG